MSGGLPRGIEEAPKPVQHLAAILADRRAYLVSVPIKDAKPGDRLYTARTGFGQVRVWRNRGVWAVELAPVGMTEFVDAGVWRACADGTELGIAPPSLAEQVAWIEGLLAARSVAQPDPSCLRDLAAERAAQPWAITGARLWVLLAIAIPVLVGAVWAAATYDLAGVRIGASVLLGGLVVALARPYAHRSRSRRRRDRGTR